MRDDFLKFRAYLLCIRSLNDAHIEKNLFCEIAQAVCVSNVTFLCLFS